MVILFLYIAFIHTQRKKLRKHEKICKDHDFCYSKMPDKDNRFLKYIPGQKSLKVSFIIYADLKNTSKNKNMSE